MFTLCVLFWKFHNRCTSLDWTTFLSCCIPCFLKDTGRVDYTWIWLSNLQMETDNSGKLQVTGAFVTVCLEIRLGIWRLGTAVAQWLKCCATNRKVAGSIPDGVIGIFHWHKILPIALWPWDGLNLQQKWVPGAFPGGKKRPVHKTDNLTTILDHCHVIWEP